MPLKKIVLFLSTLAVLGCAQNQSYIDARKMVESGNVEEGLARMEEEARRNPGDVEIRNYLARHKAVAIQQYLTAGDNARAAGQFDVSEQAYRSAQRFDAQNARAKAGLEQLAKDRATAERLAQAQAAFKKGDTEKALGQAKEILAENPEQKDAKKIVRKAEDKKARDEKPEPKLNVALKKPITMEFRDAPLRTVFELISKRTGLNFVFDRDVPPDAKATVFVRDTSIDEVIRFVLVTNQLERKVLNDNTLLVYPNSPAKQQAYRELTVKTFYLANADVKQTANMVRQLVRTRDLFIDEKLNLLVIRDTPEAVRVVEKLIANQDLAEAEVMLELEVLEIGYNRLQSLGIQWPGSIGIGLTGAAGVAGQVTGSEAKHLNGGLFRITVPDPLVTLNARQQNGLTNVLANPRIRVKSKEKARVHIGDKVPVITTTAGATGFVSESVNYLDVGLKLEVEPQVYLEDEVGIRVGLEVSTITAQTKTNSGTTAYQIGTRNASTVLRLKDGETQVLAGLISDEDRRAANRVPGLADLPGLGRLFSSNDDTVNRTEVVLLMTPRVVRNIERPGAKLEEFNAGTDAELGAPPLQLQGMAPTPSPLPGGVPQQPGAPAPQPYQPAPGQPMPGQPTPGQPVPVPGPGAAEPSSGSQMVAPTAPGSIPSLPPAAGPQPKQ
ncbi:MAG: general secretion pathway protein GspD [Betaproteobacteria bacterium]|nr:general secretion pathway protein GspD [Betaproteobacteria bacterium]